MENFLTDFPNINDLSDFHHTGPENEYQLVNGHIHTPYSFSAFSHPEQAFQMAQEENVRILGINDFYSTEGYNEFHSLSKKYRIFPLFNIEFMGLLKEEQEKGIRVNDPGNPGRIYFSGKGLDYPVKPDSCLTGKLSLLRAAGQKQTAEMLEKASLLLNSLDSRLKLDYSEVVNNYTRGMLRERHIARAIRIKIIEMFRTSEERYQFLTKLYGGKQSQADISNPAALENEIRSELLKAGGKAYVRESTEAFLELEEIIRIIRIAGGIPCYPVLLDDAKGNLTEYEQDYESLYTSLIKHEVFCIELIPGRNDFNKLKECVNFFHSRNFIITLGTEHNTPDLSPVRVNARGGTPLDDNLNRISYEGACVIAAHQYRRAKGGEGFVMPDYSSQAELKAKFTREGNAVINHYLDVI